MNFHLSFRGFKSVCPRILSWNTCRDIPIYSAFIKKGDTICRIQCGCKPIFIGGEIQSVGSCNGSMEWLILNQRHKKRVPGARVGIVCR